MTRLFIVTPEGFAPYFTVMQANKSQSTGSGSGSPAESTEEIVARRVRGRLEWEPREKAEQGRSYFVVTEQARYAWEFGSFADNRLVALRRGDPVAAVVNPKTGRAEALVAEHPGEPLNGPAAGLFKVNVSVLRHGQSVFVELGDLWIKTTEALQAGPATLFVEVSPSRPRFVVHRTAAGALARHSSKPRVSAPPKPVLPFALESLQRYLALPSDDAKLPAELASALSHLREPQELALANALKSFAQGLPAGQRSRRLSAVVARRIDIMRSHWDMKQRETVIALHLLSGRAAPSIAEREEAETVDVVAAALWNTFPSPTTDTYSLGHRFVHGTGPRFWATLRAIGDLDYRLHEFDARLGARLLVLERASHQDSDGLPQRIRIVIQISRDDPAMDQVESLLSQGSDDEPRLLLVVDFPDEPRENAQRILKEWNVYAKMKGFALDMACNLSAEKLREAKALTREIVNPVDHFPWEGSALGRLQLIGRQKVVDALYAAVHGQGLPVAIYCMRKSGKTAMGKLLAFNARKVCGAPIDCRELCVEPLARGMDLLEKKLAQAAELVILDEFDMLCRQVAEESELVAQRFFRLLQGARERAAVLCLGLDTGAFSATHPAINPYQFLPRFHLPYFDEEEANEFFARVAGALSVEPRTAHLVWRWSGGHPAVMQALLSTALRRAGEPQPRVPRGTVIALGDEFWANLATPEAAGLRAGVLTRVLSTRESKLKGIERGWRLVQAVATTLEDGAARASVDALAARVCPEQPSFELVTQLLEWGLFRAGAGGAISAGIPLLRAHLRLEQGLVPEDVPS